MPTEYSIVGLWILIGIAFVLITLGMSSLVRPHNPNAEKLTTYECGMDPIGQAWSQFFVRYYIFALIFVVFDVETVFFYPWLLNLRRFGMAAFYEMLAFAIILVVGLYYAWRKGTLRWQ